MSKKANAINLQESEKSLDMSPMIDMVFLLLVFFIVVSNEIKLKLDKKVTPVEASSAQKPESINGRIVINLYKENGKVIISNEDSEILRGDAKIEEYILERKKIIDQSGAHVPTMHIRGSKEISFEDVQQIIQIASKFNIADVNFPAINPK